MTNAPITRKTHVIRIVGTNKVGDVLQDIWVDVERIDVAKSVTQTNDSPNFQGHQMKLRWADDPNSDDYAPDGIPSRLTDIAKVCDPGEIDVNDPEEWVPVRVIRSLKGSGGGQGVQDRQRNNTSDNDPTTTRVFESRRISHYDTNIDTAAQDAFDGDPTLTVYVVPGDQYTRDDTTKDDTQFVEHEIITYLKHRTNDKSDSGDVNRGRQTKLINQYLIDESDEAKLDVTGNNGINPPYRLDPFQNIINVNLGGLAVEFFDKAL